VRVRVTEHRQDAVALGVTDVPLETLHDLHHTVAVAADHQPVGLGVDAGG